MPGPVHAVHLRVRHPLLRVPAAGQQQLRCAPPPAAARACAPLAAGFTHVLTSPRGCMRCRTGPASGGRAGGCVQSRRPAQRCQACGVGVGRQLCARARRHVQLCVLQRPELRERRVHQHAGGGPAAARAARRAAGAAGAACAAGRRGPLRRGPRAAGGGARGRAGVGAVSTRGCRRPPVLDAGGSGAGRRAAFPAVACSGGCPAVAGRSCAV